MITMQNNYNPSINIVRDQNEEITYFPTPNAMRVADQIESSFTAGIRVFNIIGSYGTGKSSFLWALTQTIKGKKHFFDVDTLIRKKVQVIPFIGDFKSTLDFLGEKFLGEKEVFSVDEIFAEIYHYFHKLGNKDALLVLLIDEFGKFLEYAAKHNPEKELYFLQQLAEFVNNPSYNIILVTTLHQNFDAYALSLSENQRREWAKVKGRFQEITFNEPVEQLLLLAGQQLKLKPIAESKREEVQSISTLFVKSKAFALKPEFALSVASELYPLDLFSASIAALAMQVYGQNERSLFSFLESNDYTGIAAYDTRTNPFYNIANLYDYLIFNYYSFLSSKYNPHFSAWQGIKTALERVENEVEEGLITKTQKIVKALGLLGLFSTKGSVLNREIIVEYAQKCLGVSEPESLLQLLLEKKIILYQNYAKRFVLTEGTDVDIQQELLLAGNQISDIEDIVTPLNYYFSFPAVFAKQYYYKTGTPRIFEFVISQYQKTNITPIGDTDGYVNLIFNDKVSVESIKSTSLESKGRPILYGYYRNTAVIRDLLKEIEKTKKTIQNIGEDRVAQRELANIKQHQEALLNHYIQHNLFEGSQEVVWIWNGAEVNINSKKQFNTLLSLICYEVYPNTPVFRSELVNRSKLSSQIHTAKRTFFRQLVNHWGEDDLGFEKDKFPPEKTIYLTLLRENGLISSSKSAHLPIAVSETSTFVSLWNAGEAYLEQTQKHRLPLTEFLEVLAKPPFKLKQGLIDFWVPTFLYLKRDEFALFGKDIYLPEINEATLELLAKSPKDYTIKAFDVEGVRLDIFNQYRQFLNQSTKSKTDNQTFIETIRPFITFYKGLPEYAKNTNRLHKESIAVRRAIITAKDPEKTFFEDFPTALGLTLSQLKKSPELLSEYVAKLQNAIRELRTCFDELVNRFELFIVEDIIYETLDFEGYKKKLKDRFIHIKQHRLLPYQKTLVMRISSDLDDRKAWLSSVAQAIVGKTLDNFRDEDEELLYDKFKTLVLELDSLSNISKNEVDEANEDVFTLEIASFEEIRKKTVRVPKKKQQEIEVLGALLRSHLGKDKTLNIAALANLLKELLKKS
jgi:hypothetical protein